MFASVALLWAGMPVITFSDIARLRLQTISFFLMGLLLSAGVVMAVWNNLRRDFTWLPRLSYGKSCGLVVLWGLLFVVVLTMISGARELMTPGAWEKNGLTYRLRDVSTPTTPSGTPTDSAASPDERMTRILQVYARLTAWSGAHDGRFPESWKEAGLDEGDRDVPSIPGTSYLLLPGRHITGKAEPLVYEPEVYEGQHFLVWTNGKLDELPYAAISRLVEESR